jgi:hypothetical protein
MQSHIIISLNPIVVLVKVLGNAVLDNEENAKLCLCPGCPTYKKSNLSNNVFCARGKAIEKVKVASCLCPNCPVFKKYTLDQMYYCVKGKSIDVQS